jgi:hypothetical protein
MAAAQHRVQLDARKSEANTTDLIVGQSANLSNRRAPICPIDDCSAFN